VVKKFDAGGVHPDVVCGPSDPEPVSAGGQLSDQVGQLTVVRISTDLGAERGDRVVGNGIPGAEEVPAMRVEANLAVFDGRTGSAKTGAKSS